VPFSTPILPAIDLGQLSEEARALARLAFSPNTLRAYQAQWKGWLAFARDHNAAAMPADPATVANWIAARAGVSDGRARDARPSLLSVRSSGSGQSIATLRTALAAIRAAHLAAGIEFDSRHPALQIVFKGAVRSQQRRPSQAKPLRGSTVAALLAGCTRRSVQKARPSGRRQSDRADSLTASSDFRDLDRRDRRDAALLALGYCFARRRSELAGLDYVHLGTGTGVLAITPTHIELRLHHSKSARVEEDVFVVPRRHNTSAVRAIERWIAVADIQPGEPVLRRVFKSGRISDKRLDAQSIALIVKRCVSAYLVGQGMSTEAAAEAARGYSGHSLRVGFAVTAAEAGADVISIQQALGHASPTMSARYAAAARKARTSPHNLDGVSLDSEPPQRTRRRKR
jgi:integrase